MDNSIAKKQIYQLFLYWTLKTTKANPFRPVNRIIFFVLNTYFYLQTCTHNPMGQARVYAHQNQQGKASTLWELRLPGCVSNQRLADIKASLVCVPTHLASHTTK